MYTYKYVYLHLIVRKEFVCVYECVHLILTLTNFHLLLLRDWNYSPIFAPSSTSLLYFYLFDSFLVDFPNIVYCVFICSICYSIRNRKNNRKGRYFMI